MMNKQIKIYADVLEESALEQFNSAMEQDFSIQGALMPDAHTGYSLPIGAVVSTEGIILPSWVGYDIGCGMCAMPTTFDADEVSKNSQAIFDAIYKYVPVGFNVHQHPMPCVLDPHDLTDLGVKAFTERKGFRSLGTLGGGNHFIEIGKDPIDTIWIIIHSGSRGVGHGVATEYMRLASCDGKVREGHSGLRTDSDQGRAYINDMNWSLQFALSNRMQMMTNIVTAMNMHIGGGGKFDDVINRNHNHAEERDGFWIHRKGATHAEDGMMGVIPGNMRDGSFIVCGKGNPDSLYSSSHGAGRVLGRKQAKRELNETDFIATMQGITAKVGASTLDESPFAYKNIYEVMELQKDLVDVVCHVKPIINIKG